jgi:integration host factor subunit beta
MNKLELISALKTKADISKSEAAKVVQIFFDSMADAMADGERVEIRGLCSFFVKEYKSYTGRNPKTGEKVTIKPKKLPFFQSRQRTQGTGGSINGHATHHLAAGHGWQRNVADKGIAPIQPTGIP